MSCLLRLEIDSPGYPRCRELNRKGKGSKFHTQGGSPALVAAPTYGKIFSLKPRRWGKGEKGGSLKTPRQSGVMRDVQVLIEYMHEAGARHYARGITIPTHRV